MNKAPAFQFYPKDAESDEVWKLMSLQQRGAFISLLSHQWINGSIPSDDTLLAALLGVNLEEFSKLWPLVSKKFEPLGEDRLVNPRLERERKGQERRRSKNKKAAQARWSKDEKSSDDGKLHASALQTHCENDANAMQTQCSSSASATSTAEEEKPPPSYSPPFAPDELANDIIREARDAISLDVNAFKAEEWAAAFCEFGDRKEAQAGVKEFFACVRARAPAGPTGYITAVLKGGAKQYLEEQKNAKKRSNGSHRSAGSERIQRINEHNRDYVPKQ